MFTVDANLKQAVEGFSWNDQESDLPIRLDDFNLLITEISNRIIAANQLRPTFQLMAKRDLSLVETCYLIVQDQDRKSGNINATLASIQQASEIEKNILSHTFKRLSADSIQLQPNDLKAITLLFGMKRISELASKNVVAFTPECTKIEEIEKTINQLVKIRDQYDINSANEVSKAFLEGVDAQIREQTEILEALKFSLSTKSA